MHFFLDCLSIILIDLLLAGDNALVIAMAVRALPPRRRGVAIGLGAALAVVCRVAITLVAARLLSLDFVQAAGGAFVLWIAVKVLIDSSNDASGKPAPPARLLQAVCWILVADLTMSTDNILAVAGASHGNSALIVFGLCVSIPFVVFSSRLLSILMDRHPWIVYLGSAILGKVGAEMLLTDPAVTHRLHPSSALRYGAEAAFAAAVVVAGKILAEPAADPDPAS